MSEPEGIALHKKDLITIRNMYPDDWNFILATWLKGLRYGNDWFGLIEAPVYYESYQKVIENILQLPITTIRVACLQDSPDVILGYSVSRGTVIDYIFVKKNWRGIGIAKSLVPDGVTTASHLTEVGKAILKKYPTITFNPFK